MPSEKEKFPLTISSTCGIIIGYTLGYRQAVRHSTLTAAFAGPNPATPVHPDTSCAPEQEHDWCPFFISSPAKEEKIVHPVHQKIIDAILKKAEKVCPDSLALIALYGSAATGDLHPKSDLDLMILIKDEEGRKLSDGFILTDAGIGYDIYCTTWEMLEEDAQCNHAQLSKLMDSKVIYVHDPDAVQKLEELRRNAAELLASDARYEKAKAALDNSKRMYAECFLTDSVSRIRTYAGAVIHNLLDAVMLHRGTYFKRGVKRTFAELSDLQLSFDMPGKIMDVIRAESAETIRHALTELLKSVQNALTVPTEKESPSPENLTGTYEEMFSNWRNKMEEAAVRDDLYSSFINMVSCQYMLQEIAECVAVEDTDLMAFFDPRHLKNNLIAYDNMLQRYLEFYRKAGITPRYFTDIDAFLTSYLND